MLNDFGIFIIIYKFQNHLWVFHSGINDLIYLLKGSNVFAISACPTASGNSPCTYSPISYNF